MSNLIRPSLDFEIYYLFYKEPVQGFILWNTVTSPE